MTYMYVYVYELVLSEKFDLCNFQFSRLVLRVKGVEVVSAKYPLHKSKLISNKSGNEIVVQLDAKLLCNGAAD